MRLLRLTQSSSQRKISNFVGLGSRSACRLGARGEIHGGGYPTRSGRLVVVRPQKSVAKALGCPADHVCARRVPGYLRNLAFVGNPIYPFFFGGKYRDSFRAYRYGLFGTGLLNEPLRLLIAPWEATILGEEGKASYEATVGPLLLTFLPLLIFVWRSVEKERVVRDLLTFVVIVYFFWLGGLATSRSLIQTRLMFPALLPLSLLTALALERVSDLDLARIFAPLSPESRSAWCWP